VTIRVETASKYDVESIMPVMASAFDPGFGEAWTADQCRGVLTLPGSTLAIAYDNDHLVGFALWRWVLDEAELLLIATDPDVQQSGIGTALLNQVIDCAKQSDILRLHVEVRSDNPALSFYRTRKFEQNGIRDQYYRRTDGGPTDAITLCRLL
jgi:[ribosomal protein S18]-alanine N-acetyltransferase